MKKTHAQEAKELQTKQQVATSGKHKALIEKAKTALIYGVAMLAIGFVVGNHYANSRSHELSQAVQSAVAVKK